MKYGKLSRKNIETLERLAETTEGKAALTEFVEKQKEARSAYKRYVKIINKKEKTPNEIRAAFIEKCKRYIAKYGEGVEFIKPIKPIDSWVAHRPLSYCVSNINGVYNEYIGKANALAWLRTDYDFVDETENAPQPTVAVRQIVEVLRTDGKSHDFGVWNRVVFSVKERTYPEFGSGRYATNYKIIDDTDAIYKEVTE